MLHKLPDYYIGPIWAQSGPIDAEVAAMICFGHKIDHHLTPETTKNVHSGRRKCTKNVRAQSLPKVRGPAASSIMFDRILKTYTTNYT